MWNLVINQIRQFSFENVIKWKENIKVFLRYVHWCHVRHIKVQLFSHFHTSLVTLVTFWDCCCHSYWRPAKVSKMFQGSLSFVKFTGFRTVRRFSWAQNLSAYCPVICYTAHREGIVEILAWATFFKQDPPVAACKSALSQPTTTPKKVF